MFRARRSYAASRTARSQPEPFVGTGFCACKMSLNSFSSRDKAARSSGDGAVNREVETRFVSWTSNEGFSSGKCSAYVFASSIGSSPTANRPLTNRSPLGHPCRVPSQAEVVCSPRAAPLQIEPSLCKSGRRGRPTAGHNAGMASGPRRTFQIGGLCSKTLPDRLSRSDRSRRIHG
jgi:hypothetical protein